MGRGVADCYRSCAYYYGDEIMLSIIIPTYNEAENIKPLVRRICKAMPKGIEIIIVDDNSPDGTGKIADKLARRYPVRVIHRAGKSGLADAVIEGFRHARGEFVGCMDADHSHTPELLPKLLETVKDGADIAVASRKVGNGRTIGWNAYRHAMSWIATALAWPLTSVRDRTSGYMVFRKKIIEGIRLNPVGYKIVLEVVVRSRSKRIIEVPFTFINRKTGKSHTNKKIILEYIRHLGRLYWFKLFG